MRWRGVVAVVFVVVLCAASAAGGFWYAESRSEKPAATGAVVPERMAQYRCWSAFVGRPGEQRYMTYDEWGPFQDAQPAWTNRAAGFGGSCRRFSPPPIGWECPTLARGECGIGKGP